MQQGSKLEFLKQLEVKSEKEKESLRCVSPVTENLKNSLAIIGN